MKQHGPTKVKGCAKRHSHVYHVYVAMLNRCPLIILCQMRATLAQSSYSCLVAVSSVLTSVNQWIQNCHYIEHTDNWPLIKFSYYRLPTTPHPFYFQTLRFQWFCNSYCIPYCFDPSLSGLHQTWDALWLKYLSIYVYAIWSSIKDLLLFFS